MATKLTTPAINTVAEPVPNFSLRIGEGKLNSKRTLPMNLAEFTTDKTSYEYQRGRADALAGRAWSSEGREYSVHDLLNYAAGFSSAAKKH
jgi:hypothetical protein